MTKIMHDHPELNELPELPEPHMMDPFIQMTKDRAIFITEDITKATAVATTALLLYYDNKDNKTPITIYINTNGGDADALIAIVDVFEIIKSPIRTIVLGKAFSAGAILVAAGTKGMRCAFKNAKIMAHGIQVGFPIPGHDITNSKNYYEFLKDHNDNIVKILSSYTGRNFNQIKKDLENDMWMDVKEAKKLGFIDNIL